MADYMYVDADNHYYEAEDAFIRHGDQDVKRYVRWVTEGKRRYMVFGSTMIGLANTSVPNPTFNPIATPARSTRASRSCRSAATASPASRSTTCRRRTASSSRCPTGTA